MILFWQAALRKKAGAKRPRVKTTIIGCQSVLSASPEILKCFQIERGAMLAWINERNTA
jgi:hypothetical protein